MKDGFDALEYIMAGASAVQIGTALYKHGRGIFNTVNAQISDFMEREKFGHISEIVGVALP